MRSYVFPGSVERVESGGYSLFFEDLPGCATGADDLASLAAMAREALELHLEGMIEDGTAIPDPTAPERLPSDPGAALVATILVEATPTPRGVVSFALPEATLKRVDEAAAFQGYTREQVLSSKVEALFAAE